MFVVAWVALMFYGAAPGLAQVSPAEILNPQLKATEQTYLTQLVALNRTVAKMRFPFTFSVSRYVGLDPKDQIGADGRGLEFVNFHDRLVLKLTGNYNAAYNDKLITPNQRVNRIFEEVIVPILRLLPNFFSPSESFDAFGFEISYHVRRQARSYAYEGKEIVVLVIDKADASSYLKAQDDSQRQEVLNRSEIYLDGKAFGLALGVSEPFNVEALERSVGHKPSLASDRRAERPSTNSDIRLVRTGQNLPPIFQKPIVRAPESTAHPELQVTPVAAPTQADAEGLQRKYQVQLDALAKEGAARYHFVDYAPPAFVIFRNQIFLQLTLRNPASFDKDTTSIYKRAAQSFDLFLALQFKPMLEKIPDSMEFGGLDVTILNELTSKSAHLSEALEFVCPLKALRQFADAEITNQELINQSVVLANGVRIALNLQLVE
jgi:hypothetical protein